MAKALPTIWQVEIINKKEFAKAVMDKNIRTFLMYIASLLFKILIYLAKKA